MINELVTEREWHHLYPEVDQEYVWEYPLFRGESEPGKNLFESQDTPLSNDLGLYIHVPFCLYRCPMCGFYMEIVKDRSFSKRYTDALIKEFMTYKAHFDFSTKKLKSVYFGGGTASLLEAEDVGRIVTLIKDTITNNETVEITVENHPNIATKKYLEDLKKIGVNRVSFGIQSFDDADLRLLKLKQREEQNVKILQTALGVGFDTVAADLIYSIPNQTIDVFLSNVNKLISMGVSTISLYSMGLSERQEDLYDLMPSQEVEHQMFSESMQLLLENGYVQVAQPDFCLPNHINHDTEITWKAPQGEQISLGAGAWSYYNNFLYCNTHNSKKYMEDVFNNGYSIQYIQKATLDDQMSRYMVLGARCFDIPDEPFKNYFGASIFDIYGQEIRLLESQGLIERTKTGISVTMNGRYYVDNISKTFYSPANRCRLQPYCYGVGDEWR